MIKILVVANPSDGVDRRVDRLRQAGYATTHTESGAAALDRLAEAIPDLVVLDWQLSRMSGAAVCRILRGDERLLGMPILVLGAGERPHERRTAEALGADDYLTYPCDLDELLQHVQVQVRGASHARYCPLTALPAGPSVGAAIRRASTAIPARTVLYVTVEHLPQYNATYGMLEGNTLIQLAARVLRQVRDHVAPGSFLGASGGGEFVLVTPPQGVAAIRQTAAAHFQQAVAAGGFYPVAGYPPRAPIAPARRGEPAPGLRVALAFDQLVFGGAVSPPAAMRAR